MPGGGASEAALNDDSEALEALYTDCARRLDKLIDAVED